jgi:hypothetical protein
MGERVHRDDGLDEIRPAGQVPGGAQRRGHPATPDDDPVSSTHLTPGDPQARVCAGRLGTITSTGARYGPQPASSNAAAE